MRPGNPWDLRRCRQEPGETLREFIRRFSRQCNDLPNVMDADVIDAFIPATTNRTLVHKLGRKIPRTTKELLDIATAHAYGEEAVGNLSRPHRGQGKEARRRGRAGLDKPAQEEVEEPPTAGRRRPHGGG